MSNSVSVIPSSYPFPKSNPPDATTIRPSDARELLNQIRTSSVPPINTKIIEKRKSNILFSTARYLVENSNYTYEQICALLDNGDSKLLSHAAKELAKTISNKQANKGGRKIAETTLIELAKMKITEEELDKMDEKTRSKALADARLLAKATKLLQIIK